MGQCRMSSFLGGDNADYAGWNLIVVIAALIMEPVAGETRPRNAIKSAMWSSKKTAESTDDVDESGLWE